MEADMMKALVTALGLVAAVPAAASETRIVTYDDLNLANPAGMARLEKRINSAARSACGASQSRTGPGEFVASRLCVEKAKSDARAQVAEIEKDMARGG
jgi:UrcA family protein